MKTKTNVMKLIKTKFMCTSEAKLRKKQANLQSEI